MLVNLMVAASNAAGLATVYAAYRCDTRGVFLLMCLVVTASVLQHLSDRKHGLPGACFQRFHRELLWLDRFAAVAAGAFVLWRMTQKRTTLPLLTGLPGLVFMGISENPTMFADTVKGEQATIQLVFGLIHCIWHVLAYTTLTMMVCN